MMWDFLLLDLLSNHKFVFPLNPNIHNHYLYYHRCSIHNLEYFDTEFCRSIYHLHESSLVYFLYVYIHLLERAAIFVLVKIYYLFNSNYASGNKFNQLSKKSTNLTILSIITNTIWIIPRYSTNYVTWRSIYRFIFIQVTFSCFSVIYPKITFRECFTKKILAITFNGCFN